jgi:hypothetical protein
MAVLKKLTHAWFHSRGPAHPCVTCSRKRKVTHVKNVRKVMILNEESGEAKNDASFQRSEKPG